MFIKSPEREIQENHKMSPMIVLNLSFGITSCLLVVQQTGIGAEHGGPIGLSRAAETRLFRAEYQEVVGKIYMGPLRVLG